MYRYLPHDLYLCPAGTVLQVALVPLAGSVPSMTTAYYRYVVMTYCTSVQLVRLVALVPLSWECPEYDHSLLCSYDLLYLCSAGRPGSTGPPSWECPEYDHSLPPECYPQLDYSAPELALLGTITPAADMFSYGMLAFRYKFSIIIGQIINKKICPLFVVVTCLFKVAPLTEFRVK